MTTFFKEHYDLDNLYALSMRERRDQIIRYMNSSMLTPNGVVNVVDHWFITTNRDEVFGDKLEKWDVRDVHDDVIIMFKLDEDQIVTMRYTQNAQNVYDFVGYQLDWAPPSQQTFDPNDAWDRAMKGI